MRKVLHNIGNKALTVLLALFLLLAFGSSALARDSITVYVTGCLNDSRGLMLTDGAVHEEIVPIAQLPVEVSDLNGNGYYDIDDVLTAVHNGYCVDGYAKSASGYINKLWGISTSNVGYCLNNETARGLTQKVKDGDYLTAWVYGDSYCFDYYAYFDRDVAVVMVDGELQLSVDFNDNMWGYAADFEDSDLIVGVIDEYGSVNDSFPGTAAISDGVITAGFTSPGQYYLAVQLPADSYEYITTPVCKVIVVPDDNEAITALLQQDADNLSIAASLSRNIDLPSTGQNGTVITWKSSDTGVITATGRIKPDSQADKQAVLTATVTLPGSELKVEKEFPVTVLKADNESLAQKEVQAVKESLTFDIIKSANQYPWCVRFDLDLYEAASYDSDADTVTFGSGDQVVISWKSSDQSVILNGGHVTCADSIKKVSLTATISHVSGLADDATVKFDITVLDSTATWITIDNPYLAKLLANNIAASWQKQMDTGNYPWVVADMAAADKLGAAAYASGNSHSLTESQKQAYVDHAVARLADADAKSGDLAKYIIGLSALGYDAHHVVTAQGNEFDAVALLKAKVSSEDSIYTLPYMVIAFRQFGDDYTIEINTLVKKILDNQLAEGGWNGYGTTADADTTAPVLLALAGREDAADPVNKALAALESSVAFNENDTVVSWGSDTVESTALLAAGLAAVGHDPADFYGHDLLNGIIAMADASGNGFLYGYENSLNATSTEQGFRGLIACLGYAANKGAYNIYDFSANQDSRIYAIASQAEQYTVTFDIRDEDNRDVSQKAVIRVYDAKGAKVAGDVNKYQLYTGDYTYVISCDGYIDAKGSFSVMTANKTVRVNLETDGLPVTFRLIGDSEHGSSGHENYFTWYATREYIMAEGDSAWDLIRTALNKAKLSYDYKNGYLSAVENPLTGEKLAELDNGKNSGWMYVVYDKDDDDVDVSRTAINKYMLNDGDQVILYYTDDYTEKYKGFSVKDIDPSLSTLKNYLSKSISVAESLLEEIYVSEDGSDVPANKLWVKQADYNALQKALKAAQKVYDDKNSDYEDYQDALSDLAAAKEKFENAARYGNMAGATFYDVPASHWAYHYITDLAASGAVQGYGGFFYPERNITRADFVTMLARMSGKDMPYYYGGFTDISGDKYYAQPVAWAAAAGIVNGYSDNSFRPDSLISRQEMAAMLYRYAIYLGKALPAGGYLGFTDSNAIGYYAAAAVSSLHQAGIIGGYPGGSFQPLGYGSRAEAVKMIYLLDNYR